MTLRRRRTHNGFSLVELLVSTGLLVGGGGVLLAGMYHGLLLVDYLSDQQVVVQAVQGKLEELAAMDFDELATGVKFVEARTPRGMAMCAGEDANCDHILNPDEVDTNGNGRADQLLPLCKLHVRIRTVPTKAETFTTATMLDISVAASWRLRSRCIGGEDSISPNPADRCNGLLDKGEDRNGNGWLDTPVMFSTRVARRD